MANVTQNDNEWDVQLTPGESLDLKTARTYVDRDINISAVKIIKSKFFDDVWAGPLGKTTAEAKAINSGKSGTTDGSTWGGQYRIYFGKIRVTGIDKTNTATAGVTWDVPWHIRFRVTVKMFYRDANGNKIYHNDGKGQYDWNIYGNGTTYTYSNFNNKYNWTPQYYHMINRPQASFMKSTNDSPILWGINFNSTNSTYSNRSYYKREYTIDVLECDGCEIDFLDDWECVRNYHIANATVHPRGAATYYYGYLTNNGSNTDVDATGFTDYDAVNNGLKESGDDNSTQEFYHYSPIKAGGQGIHGHAIIGQLADGSYASFTTNSGQSSASVVKQINTTDEFIYGGHTLYYIANNNYAAGTTTGIAAYWNYYALDVRYLSNYYGTSSSASPTLAFGWSGSGTTAAYSRAWIKVEFTEDNKRYKIKSLLLNDRDRSALGEGYYMLVGSNYNSVSEYYRIATLQEPRIYYVDENSSITVPDFLSTVAYSGSYNDLSDKPTIPSAVTESTVSGWGFTKNTGTYSKPSGGIPKTDLASAVQTSLGKADSALQSYTETDPVYSASASAKYIKESGKNVNIATETISATGGNINIGSNGGSTSPVLLSLTGNKITLDTINTEFTGNISTISDLTVGGATVNFGTSETTQTVRLRYYDNLETVTGKGWKTYYAAEPTDDGVYTFNFGKTNATNSLVQIGNSSYTDKIILGSKNEINLNSNTSVTGTLTIGSSSSAKTSTLNGTLYVKGANIYVQNKSAALVLGNANEELTSSDNGNRILFYESGTSNIRSALDISKPNATQHRVQLGAFSCKNYINIGSTNYCDVINLRANPTVANGGIMLESNTTVKGNLILNGSKSGSFTITSKTATAVGTSHYPETFSASTVGHIWLLEYHTTAGCGVYLFTCGKSNIYLAKIGNASDDGDGVAFTKTASFGFGVSQANNKSTTVNYSWTRIK